MMVTDPPAGTVMLVMLSQPVPLAPPVGVELSVAPAGMLTTVNPGTLAGMLSVTETPVAAAPPLSVTVIVYSRVSPKYGLPPSRSTTVFVVAAEERSGLTTVVGSLMFVLFPAMLSKAPLVTLTLLITLGIAAAPTETVRVMAGAVAPFTSGLGMVQVTVCPAALQAQPVPVALT